MDEAVEIEIDLDRVFSGRDAAAQRRWSEAASESECVSSIKAVSVGPAPTTHHGHIINAQIL